MFDTKAFVTLIGILCLTHAGQAQYRTEYPRPDRIDPGTVVTIRTNESIYTDRRDARVYTAQVDRDVRNNAGAIVIPRGSSAELMVRTAPDGDLILDLDSLVVNGERYAIRTDPNRVSSSVGANDQAGAYVGGGAILGSIIGAIAGGGKGAAIGAAAGAAAGAGMLTRGQFIRVPGESLLTFRLERGLDLGVPDAGYNRDGVHYHGSEGR